MTALWLRKTGPERRVKQPGLVAQTLESSVSGGLIHGGAAVQQQHAIICEQTQSATSLRSWKTPGYEAAANSGEMTQQGARILRSFTSSAVEVLPCSPPRFGLFR